jgi:hypothetical protein
MKHILLLTSTSCKNNTFVNNLVVMLNENDCSIISNSMAENVVCVTEPEILVAIGKRVHIIVTMFTDIYNTEDPYINTIHSIDRPTHTYHIDTGNSLTPHIFLHNYCNGYFKLNLRPHIEECLPYIQPIKSVQRVYRKSYDIFCLSSENSIYMKICQKLQVDGLNVVIRHKCSLYEYENYIKRSYITLAMNDTSDCYLHIISLRGVCCRKKNMIQFHKDYDSSMMIEYEHDRELYDILKAFSQLKHLLVDMAERSYTHYQLHHTAFNLGKYLLSHMYIDK